MCAKNIISLLMIFICVQLTLGIHIVPRSEWKAAPPRLINTIPNNLPYVFVHHSASPAACYEPEDCKAKMRSMQVFHQKDRDWEDIGYSFAIGGDGNIYEGRGFNVQGAHTIGYNKNAYGICLIGNWSESPPPKIMLVRLKELIQYGVQIGKISAEYKLLGHRQVSSTECPGNYLFDIIKKWPHFSEEP